MNKTTLPEDLLQMKSNTVNDFDMGDSVIYVPDIVINCKRPSSGHPACKIGRVVGIDYEHGFIICSFYFRNDGTILHDRIGENCFPKNLVNVSKNKGKDNDQ